MTVLTPGKMLSLEELGKLVHLHPVYLSKLYKQETGSNLSSHISLKRLEKAAQLLTDSTLHVVDISLLVGYKKSQYFIKLFKEQYGITPYQYRRMKCEAVK
jgi:AraC-type DNA-binding domain-containing proteins